jgi:hypothetical protein
MPGKNIYKTKKETMLGGCGEREIPYSVSGNVN